MWIVLLLLVVGVYSQDPLLSHLVGRYWYYQTGGGHQVSGLGTGGSGYKADGGHGVQDNKNVQHDHMIINDPQFVNAERNLETYEVLPASTFKLNMPDVIPDASLKLQLNQADLSPSSEIGTKYSDKIVSVTVMPSLSTLLKDSRFDYLISESSTQALETPETTQHDISSAFPEINSHSPARVRELRPGSGRIIRAKRVAASGAELMDWFGGKMVILMFLIWFMM